ncbi:putative ribonuclease H-like domain-containing protein [Tanacetum coccineum]
MTHPHPNRRFVPQAVLTRSGKINSAVRPVNTAGSKTTVNHPRPISNVYKNGYSQVTRPFNKYSANKNSIFNKKVNTIKVKDTTTRDRAVVSKNKEKEVNAVKASACWGNPQQKDYKEKGVIDNGCSRHMTGNKYYLTKYKDYDGGFVSFRDDPHFPYKVYKVEKALYGLHQAPRAWYKTLSTYLIENGFRRGTIDKTLFIKKDKGDISLQVQQKEDGIFISQDKYVAEILKKFDFATIKTASTPIETNKALVKDEEAEAVDVHLYRSMIRSLMYLTASRLDIMFVVCACARDSPFDLEAFSDSDYVGASLDRKSTTGEYVVAANCCEQVLWIQNQMLDYGFNFMNTKIYIDNESTICIVKNPVFHSKTKHIEIRHHFIRDSYEKKLIQVGDEAVHKELGDTIERVATTASSLEAEQDSGNINRTQSMATLNEPSP